MITWWKGIILTSLAGIFVCCSIFANAQTTRFQQVELLDARTWNFSKRLPLSGTWSFVENKLLSPQTIKNENLATSIFPSIWNEHRPDGKGTGYATYALNVVIPDSLGILALEIPSLNTSYNLWVNGNLIASAGTVGTEKEKTIPQWVHKTVSFTSTSDTVKIVLQLANFHHNKGGGGRNAIYLGTEDRIKSHFNWAIGSNMSEAIILFIEGIVFLFVYRRMDKSVILYFSLLCMTWSIRSIFSNLYPLILVFPNFNWEWQVKIEYITLYLTVIWAALFFTRLFKESSNALVSYLPVVVNIIFVIFTLLTPAIVFSRWISIYLGVAALVILYAVILIIRALITDREGSWFLMSTIWIGVLLFGYDIVAYQSSFSYNIVFLNIGYVLIFMLTTIALLFHLGIFKTKTKEKDFLTYKDLYQSDKR
jgi:7TM diverse intracellular signalling